MTAEDFRNLLRADPFVPFRVHGTDGRTWDVRGLGNASAIRTHVALPVWGDDRSIPERSEYLTLDQIARVEIPIASAGVPA